MARNPQNEFHERNIIRPYFFRKCLEELSRIEYTRNKYPAICRYTKNLNAASNSTEL